MDAAELQKRTKLFAIRVIKLCKTLEKDFVGRIIANQLLRSATSIAANYRAVCRAKSLKDFIAKLAVVIEESDESVFWIELLIESNIIKSHLISNLLEEANAITAIMVASRHSAIVHSKSKNQ